MITDGIVVTGIGIELPGVDLTGVGPAGFNAPIQLKDFDFESRLGKHGYKYKDRATRIALCAAKDALSDAALPTASKEQVSPERFGVIASSNLCNLDTVCKVVYEIRTHRVDRISPMDLPNASSNEVASNLAIWFGLKAFSLMICNGATSGIDALYIGASALRAGRAERILVVGVEPLTPVVETLMRESVDAWVGNAFHARLGEGAGALVLETAAAARERGAKIYGSLAGYGYADSGDIEASLLGALESNPSLSHPIEPVDLWLCPNTAFPSIKKDINALRDRWGEHLGEIVDLGMSVGELYGALGVIQCALAFQLRRQYPFDLAVATSGGCFAESVASIAVRPAG